MSDIKDIIAQNLTKLRQANNLTQLDLAERLNYSDKSISKWEHGDATPPINVLKDIADLYGVSLDFLVSENPNEVYDKTYGNKNNNKNKIIITLLSVSLVWLAAVIVYVYASIISNANLWILFILSVPASTIILIVFNSIWGKAKFTYILISVLIWSTLLTIYLLILSSVKYNTWMIFFIGIPIQIGVILWSQLKSTKK